MFKLISNIKGSSSIITPQSKKNCPGDLKAVVELASNSLKQTKNFEQRSKSYSLIAKTLIKKAENWNLPVNWAHFALLHNASLISNTSLEGGVSAISVQQLLYIFRLWEKGEGYFFSINLSKEELAHICEVLEDVLHVETLLLPFSYSNDKMSESEIEDLASQLLNFVKLKLQSKNEVYLNLGYCSGVSNDGHVIACKIVLKDKKVKIYFLNSGDGANADSHPILNMTTSQEKFSFKSFPFVCSEELFWSKMGHAAFCHLLRYKLDRQNPDVDGPNPYKAEECYEILYILGDPTPEIEEQLSECEAKGQRTGSCAAKAGKRTVQDVLIGHGKKTKEIKLILANAYMCSIIMAYYDYIKNPSEIHCKLLRNAVEEFGLAALKLKEGLDKDEIIAIASFTHEILKLTKSFQAQQIHAKKIKLQKEGLGSVSNSFPQVPLGIESKMEMTLSKSDKISSFSKTRLDIASIIDPLQLSQLLPDWIDYIKTLPAEMALDFLFDCACALPLPKWGKIDAWDSIPKEKITETVRDLESLLSHGLEKIAISEDPSSFFNQFLIIHTFYVVIDKLARCNPLTRLQGFASPFLPHIYGFEIEDFTSVAFGDYNYRYSQIIEYFLNSKKEAKNRVIFPIESELPIENFIKESISSNKTEQGTTHILFLQQFLLQIFPHAKKSKLSPLYQLLWVDSSYLPSEIHSLYYCSFLSFVLFTGNKTHFPQQLQFASSFDNQGKQSVIIQCAKELFYKGSPHQINKEGLWFEEGRFAFPKIVNFFPFYKQEYRTLSTNQAVCARLSTSDAKKWGITEAIFRDLLRITRNNKLKALLALEWVGSNYIYLGHPKIQILLEHCFFAPGLLTNWLESEPGIVAHLREVVTSGLDYYRNNVSHLSSILFLIRIGIGFESFYKALFPKKSSDEQLLFYKKCLQDINKSGLDEKSSSLIKLHDLYLDSQREEFSIQEAVDLYLSIIAINSERNTISIHWLEDRLPDLIRIVSKKMKGHLLNEQNRNQICEALARGIYPNFGHQNSQWLGEFPVFHFANYKLDFLKGTLIHEEKGRLIEMDKDFWIYNHYIDYGKIHGSLFWENEEGYYSEDGKLKILISKSNEYDCQRLITLGSQQIWCRVYQFPVKEIDNRKMPFLNNSSIVPWVHYIPVVRRSTDPEVICFDAITDKPFLKMESKSDQWVMTRLDENGTSLPIQLVNLSEVAKAEPLYWHTARFSPPEEILCFIHTSDNEIEEINFYHLKLQFKRSVQGLESRQFPGFFLQPFEQLEELNSYQSAMVLKNKEGLIKIILPSKKLALQPGDFNTEAFALSPFSGYIKYHQYDQNPVDKSLKAADSYGYLYLSYLFKMQSDYKKAYKYLEKIKLNAPFDENFQQIFSLFFDSKDRSPIALAFNMKLVYLAISNKNLMTEEQFGEKSSHYYFTHIVIWAIEEYTHYLRSMSQENLSAIPQDLRLIPEQEKIILQTITNYAEKQNYTLPQIISVRKFLMCSKNQKTAMNIAPKKSSLRPAIYSQLSEPKDFADLLIKDGKLSYGKNCDETKSSNLQVELIAYPNRITPKVVRLHFAALYERAKNCTAGTGDPFDFTLLAFLKVKEFTANKMAQVLFYVRHFPHHFKNYTLSDVQEEKDAIFNFNHIIEKVVALQGEQEYLSFKKDFLGAEVTFNYAKKGVLEIPKSSSVHQPLPLIDTKKQEKKPFQNIFKLVFNKKSDPAIWPSQPGFIDDSLTPPKDSLEALLSQEIINGYKLLRNKKNNSYLLITDNLEKAKGALLDQKKGYHNELEGKNKLIKKLANSFYKLREGKLERCAIDEEVEFKLRKDTHQTMILSPEMLMKEVVLKNDFAFLLKHRPLMSSNEMKELVQLVNEYYHLLVLAQICDRCFSLVEKLLKNPSNTILQEDLAYLLDYEFLYDPQHHPEISFFAACTGMLPREEQAKVYFWICEGLKKKQRRLFQLPAGAGKSSYLEPLMMLRAMQEGLMPIVITTQAIYSVDKEKLSTTLSKLGIELSLLEVGLHMKLTVEKLEFIYQQLQHSFKMGKGLLMTPQAYYTLKLMHRFAALKEKDENKVKWISLIINFFKTNCLLLVDELDRNLDALTKAIFGTGDFQALPSKELELFLELLKPLLGIESFKYKEKEIAEVARLKQNYQGSPGPAEIKFIQEALVEKLSESQLLEIPENQRLEFKKYWMDRDLAQPSLLHNWSQNAKNLADLIALGRYFMQELLTIIEQARTEVDHGRSPYPEEQFDTPRQQGTPSTAQFEDPYRALALSVKGTFHRGLDEIQVRSLIEKMIQQNWQELNEYGLDSETPTAKLFKSWVEWDSTLRALRLVDVSLADKTQMELLTKLLYKNSSVIEYYLTHFVLPQIGFYLEQLSCGPSHLVDDSAASVYFSATPFLPIIYPRPIHAMHLDPVFEAQVIAELSKPKNQKVHLIEGPAAFFKEMKEGNLFYRKAKVLNDPGGFFCDFSNEQVSEAWLDASDLDGVLYFKTRDALSVDGNEKVCLLLKKTKKVYELDASDLKGSLLKQQLDWDLLDIGAFYDITHTQATDFPLKAGIHALVFAGDNLTRSRLIQAVMRLRDFLNEAKGQSIAWVFQTNLAAKIPKAKDQSLNAAAIYAWSTKNEAEEIKRKIVLAAFQEIAFLVEKIANDEIKNQMNDPKVQIQLFEKFSTGFVEFIKHDPYGCFSGPEQMNSTKDVLWAYATFLYDKYNYEGSFEDNTDLKKELLKVIQEVSIYVKQIPISFERSVVKKVETQRQIKKEVEEIQFRPRAFDPLAAEGIYGTLDIWNPNYVKDLWAISAKGLFKTSGLTKNLYFEINQARTAKNNEVHLEDKFIKPIDFFLIVIESNQHSAFALSNDVLPETIEKLNTCPEDLKLNHKAFLVSARGELCLKGKGALAPSNEVINTILNSEWMLDLAIDAELLRGQVYRSDRLSHRMKTWENFISFWNHIIESLPNKETANLKGMEKLLRDIKKVELRVFSI